MLIEHKAGSNTISLFRINPENPSQLTLLGLPVWSGGEFPMSAAFNEDGSRVCVLNGGKVAGVRCGFTFLHDFQLLTSI